MKAFVSWSGGKDCMFAMYHFLNEPENEVACLVHFAQGEVEGSRSHRIGKELMAAQAAALGIPLIREVTDTSSYREHLIRVMRHLKSEGVTAGVFGDIYLEAHRNWIEAVCAETGITACFPLWGRPTEEIVKSFVQKGFKAQIIAVKESTGLRPLVGKQLNPESIAALCALKGIDPCGENGEYHTFVFDGPLFSHPVAFRIPEQTETFDHHIFQAISHV